MEIDIDKLALLARIKLDSKEKKSLQKEFEDILNYVSKLKETDIKDIDEKEAGKTIEFENVMREDENPHKAGEFSKDLLKEAPSIEKNFIKVKRILE
ncbi:MAG: Asp-tRNA(Asn)/Glu-tRNA(Gln) amidotransferase subunit GatC [Patescibacteria group bacterium]